MARCSILLFGLLLVSTPVVISAAPQSATTPQQHQEQLLKLIPNPLPLQAMPQGRPTFYEPANLYQYMDGGADAYFPYDFRVLMHHEFRVAQVDVTVDVFDMGEPENAFGIYAAERSPKYQFVSIGSEGYQNEGILNFLQGQYYVKLAGFGDGADSVLEQFAKALSAKIGGTTALPALLQQLPQGNRKPRSEQYLRRDPLGHDFLGPAYIATYSSSNSQESTLLVSVAVDEADAQKRFDLLKKHFRNTGQCDPAPELGANVIRGSNSFEGKVLAQPKGRYVIVLFNPVAGAPELLKATVEGLK